MNSREEHLARSVKKMRDAYEAHQRKKMSRTIVFLDEAPERVVEKKNTSGICQAFTLKGKKCTFRAVNGCYCKKHHMKDSESVLGTKKIIL